MWQQYFSKIFFFKQSLILPGYFLMMIICQTFANICCAWFFLKIAESKKCLLFFYPRVNASLIPSSAKSPGWKISGRFSILRIKSRSTIIVKNWSNKNLPNFCWGRNFSWFLREKMDLFDRISNGTGSLLEKQKYGLLDRPQQVITKLYGFQKLTEVFTPVEFHFEEI